MLMKSSVSDHLFPLTRIAVVRAREPETAIVPPVNRDKVSLLVIRSKVGICILLRTEKQWFYYDQRSLSYTLTPDDTISSDCVRTYAQIVAVSVAVSW